MDYSANEDEEVITVTVIKENTNIGDFILTLTPFSISQFSDSGFPLPSELVGRDIEPAEGELEFFSFFSRGGGLLVAIAIAA